MFLISSYDIHVWLFWVERFKRRKYEDGWLKWKLIFKEINKYPQALGQKPVI